MWILYPLLFFAGFVDSIAGGGGLISVSSFLAAGLPPHVALATNKFSAFTGTGLSAAYFVRKGHVHWRAAGCALVGALVGSAAGARLVLEIDGRILSWLLLAAIPAVAVVMILKRDDDSGHPEGRSGRLGLLSFAIGFGIGAYDGFFGPGTGTFLILAFTMVAGFDLLTACGNTKVVNFASNLSGVAVFIASGDINYRLGIPCALCSIAGNLVGTHLTMRNGARIVRPMMLFVMTLLLAKIVWDMVRQGAGI